MADILIPEFMDETVANRLKADYDVYWDVDLWGKREELLERVGDARAIIVRNATQVDAELLEKAPDLKVVARLGVGLDNIDLDSCKARGIEVCPAIGANANSVAEYVITTAAILLRGQGLRSTADVVAGSWDRQRFSSGLEIAGRTLGVIGFGSIGQIMGAKGAAMGMKIIAYDALLPDDAPAWDHAEKVALEDLIARSDVITLHCPLIPQTRNLIDAAAFEAMKPGTILVNSARGGIVNEAACAAALRSGHLGGAALDTLDTEPITPETGKLFAGIDNLILTPHIAGVTQDANIRISEVAEKNVRRVLGT
ncbi:MAG: hydroxyacid dehydrogenase [Pseudomonadota bacterium]